MAFDFEAIKDILVCPKSRSALVHDGDRLVNVDPECRLSYAICDEIPIMLVDEATELGEGEWQAVMHRHDRDPRTGELLLQPSGGQETGADTENVDDQRTRPEADSTDEAET